MLVTREELTAERIEQIVQDARKAGYDFFLTAEQRAASLAQARLALLGAQEEIVARIAGVADDLLDPLGGQLFTLQQRPTPLYWP